MSVVVDFFHRVIQEVVEKEVPKRREDYMTIAEELREEGREEGIERALDVILKLREKFGEGEAFDLAAEIKEMDTKKLDRIEQAIEEAENIEELREKI